MFLKDHQRYAHLTDEEFEKEMEKYSPYPLNAEQVKLKVEEALKLSRLIDKLLGEAASGGLRDIGSFPDEYSEKLMQKFNEAQAASSVATANITSLKRETDKLMISDIKKIETNGPV